MRIHVILIMIWEKFKASRSRSFRSQNFQPGEAERQACGISMYYKLLGSAHERLTDT